MIYSNRTLKVSLKPCFSYQPCSLPCPNLFCLLYLLSSFPFSLRFLSFSCFILPTASLSTIAVLTEMETRRPLSLSDYLSAVIFCKILFHFIYFFIPGDYLLQGIGLCLLRKQLHCLGYCHNLDHLLERILLLHTYTYIHFQAPKALHFF